MWRVVRLETSGTFLIDFTKLLLFRLPDVDLGWPANEELKIIGKKTIVANIQFVIWIKWDKTE